MKGRITHIPLFRVCISYHFKLIISVAVVSLLIISISTGFCGEKISIKDKSYQPANEPVYIIPDQSYSPLKFGVALTPEQTIHSMDSVLYYSNVNQLDDEQLQPQQTGDII